jgi:hypothetical protein
LAKGFGSATLTHQTDEASAQVLSLVGPNRATPADNDEIYVSFTLEDSAANDEFARITAVAEDVTTTEEDGALQFDVNVSGTLTQAMRLESDVVSGGAADHTQLILPQYNDAATPTLAFGDGDSGFYESSDDALYQSVAGVARFFSAAGFGSAYKAGIGGGTLWSRAPSATVPSVTLTVPSVTLAAAADSDTGIGRAGADQLSLIAGALEVVRVDGTVGTKGQVLLPQEDLAATPTLAFGDGDTGIYESADGTLSVSVEGAKVYDVTAAYMMLSTSAQPAIMNETASDTNPVFSFRSDTNTGIGKATGDQLSLIAGGIEGLRVKAESSICTFDFDAGDNGAEQVGALTSLKSVSATVPGAAAATITATNLIPAGSFVIGITGRIQTTFGGAITSMNIGDGSDVDRWGTGIAITGDTTFDLTDATAAAGGWFTTATSVVFTGNVAFEASGSLDVIVHYFDLTAATA